MGVTSKQGSHDCDHPECSGWTCTLEQPAPDRLIYGPPPAELAQATSEGGPGTFPAHPLGVDRSAVVAPPASREWTKESVMMATPVAKQVATCWSASMFGLQAHDQMTHGLTIRGGGLLMLPAGLMNLPDIRNDMCQAALDQGADWLCFVDADAGFNADAVDRLVEAADPASRPVVGALAFQVQRRQDDGMGGYNWQPAPTIFDYGGPNGEPGFFTRYDYPENTLTRCSATGCHMLLIHRTVLEAMKTADTDPDTGRGRWFSRFAAIPAQGLMGEDFAFCWRLNALGIPLFVHTGVETIHQQTVWVGEQVYQAHRMVSLLTDQVRAEEAAKVPAGVKVAGDG